jgi:5-formyltetrahydrofolate cyclo-ligase
VTVNKEAIRERVWDELEESGVARFPFPPHGRIPNFEGADQAADRLAGAPEWERADALKANPDSPQRPVREAALDAGKTVYMAVPRLADEEPFLELDPDRIDEPSRAATLSGSEEYGTTVGPDAVEVDLVVSGSVAVHEDGARIGKGEGYADLEWGVLWDLGIVDGSTPVVTTVHERQVRGEDWEPDAHDVPMDLLVTPERVVRTDATGKPEGVDWEALPAERLSEIPVLARLAPD